LRLETTTFPARGLIVVQSLAALGMAWSRPEGTLVAGLALLPFFCAARLSVAGRALPVLTLGVASLAWQSYAAAMRIQAGGQVGSSVLGLLVLSGVLCAAGPLVAWKRSERLLRPLLRHLPWLAELGLWLLLLGLSWRDSTILKKSLRATFDNFVLQKAAWGSSGVLLALLVCAVLGLLRIPGALYLRFPVTTFLPLAFVAAYLRGTPFRAGNWDSLARMTIHIVPLAIVLLALGALGRFRSWPEWTRRLRKTDAETKTVSPASGAPQAAILPSQSSLPSASSKASA
jgi:hypothetical protein